MKLKRLVALTLALILVIPSNIFALPENNISYDKVNENKGTSTIDVADLEKMNIKALISQEKALPDIGKVLRERQDFVVNENSKNPDIYFKPNDKVRVIIEVKGRPITNMRNTNAVQSLKNTQGSVRSQIQDLGIDFEERHQFFMGINGFSATVEYKDIEAIKKLSGVTKVHISRKYAKDMENSREMVNADIVNKAVAGGGLGLKGEGMLVAIVDTGIDYTHKDLCSLTDPAKGKYTEDTIAAKLNKTEIDDKWYNAKVVSGYDWADEDHDVIPDLSKPLASHHGVHVAGTVAANGSILGIAPEAQLLAEKVFSDEDKYAYDDDIIAGLNHAIELDADVINMSLGSNAGFVGPEDPIQPVIQSAVNKGIIVCVSAGNAGHNTKGEGPYPFAQNPDIGLVGSPGVAENTIQIAAIENTYIKAAVFNYFVGGVVAGKDIIYMPAGNLDPKDMDDIELVDCGYGVAGSIPTDVSGKIALVQRGQNSFVEKQQNVQAAGAAGIIVYNHPDGGDELISMKTYEELNIPAVFIGNKAGKDMMDKLDKGVTVKFTDTLVTLENPVKGQMMDGSAWGLTPNLDFKPELTAPGGNIYSTVNGDEYESMSGTSMSSPHVAGAAVLLAQYLKGKGIVKDANLVNLAKKMLMNTAEIIINPISEGKTPYSPRLQGSGLMKIDKAIITPVTVQDDKGKAAVSLREIGDITTFTLQLKAFSDLSVTDAVYYNVYANVFTDYIFSAIGYEWNALETDSVDGARIKVFSKEVSDTVYESVYVKKDGVSDVEITIDLSGANLPSESFVEGFIKFIPTSQNPDIPQLTVPYVGFYGDWDKPQNVDPGLWEPDSYGGYTGLYDPVPEYDDKGELVYKLYQLGQDLKKNVDPENAAISPNGDGHQDMASTVFTLLRNAKEFKLYVTDSKGAKVREIFYNKENDLYKEGIRKNSTYGGENWYTVDVDSFSWDGRLKDGQVAPDGKYNIVMETTIDYPGAVSQKYELPVKVDTVEPSISIPAITPNNGKYNISWTASDDRSGIQFTAVSVDGGEFQFTDSSNLIVDNKPKSVFVAAYDYAGNVAVNSYNSITPSSTSFDKNAYAQTDISVTINGSKLVSIKNGQSTLTKDKDYTLSSNRVTIKKTYLAGLPLGNTLLNFEFELGNSCTMKINVVDTTSSGGDNGSGGGSGNGGGSGGSGSPTSGSTAPSTPQSISPGVVSLPTPSFDSATGTARVSVSAEALNKALNSAVAGADGKKHVVIPIAAVKGAKKYELAIPPRFLASGDGSDIQIQTEFGTLFLPGNMFSSTELAGLGSNIIISLELVDNKNISPSIKALVGDKAVYDISLKINGVNKGWSNANAPMTILLNYKATAEELKNPDNIVIWYIDENNNTVVTVPNSRYDSAAGRISFRTTHLSKYAVSYVEPGMTDLDGFAWASKQINAVVAKEILKPATKTNYDPKADITRADFLYGLIRALGLSAKVDGNFDDVTADDYYYNEIAVAKKLGITTGVGGNKINPDEAITRQDMMTMINRALNAAKKNNAESTADLSKFADNEKIAAYARDGVSKVVAEGIITGDGKNINPLSNTTRAEAAIVVYRLLNK